MSHKCRNSEMTPTVKAPWMFATHFLSVRASSTLRLLILLFGTVAKQFWHDIFNSLSVEPAISPKHHVFHLLLPFAWPRKKEPSPVPAPKSAAWTMGGLAQFSSAITITFEVTNSAPLDLKWLTCLASLACKQPPMQPDIDHPWLHYGLSRINPARACRLLCMPKPESLATR
jgi:hypothetical protein